MIFLKSRCFVKPEITISGDGSGLPSSGGLRQQSEGIVMPAFPGAARRPKLFTDGRQTPLDRNDRARLLFLAKAARRRGELTRAAVEIFEALLYRFANLRDGRCFPSYERLAEAAGCVARTVGRVLPALERVGLLAWVHRIRRLRTPVEGLPGVGATDWRVVRTSNSYSFPLARLAPAPSSKGHFGSGTGNEELFSTCKAPPPPPASRLEVALARFGERFKAGAAGGGDFTSRKSAP
jgi:hypothetical protein